MQAAGAGGEHSKAVGDFHEAIGPLKDFRFCHPLALNTAQPFHFGVRRFFDADIAYDLSRVNDEVPTLGDLQRLLDEQIILFITGERPLDQWGDFMQELSQAGIDQWSDALTAQYNELSNQ